MRSARSARCWPACTPPARRSRRRRTRPGSHGSAAVCPDHGRSSGIAIPDHGTSWPQTAGPTALIDFEFAGPVDADWDLAQAAWLNAQLHDDDIAERRGLPAAAARARQLKAILDGYGLSRRDRDGFVDKMITFAVHDARAEAVSAGVTPDTASAATPDGYPYAWAITWRVRSASWMLTNRSLLQRAIA
jgi:hypothetical protein